LNVSDLNDALETAAIASKGKRDLGEIGNAIDKLTSTITMVESSVQYHEILERGNLSDPERELIDNLSDCIGMLGGHYRRQGQIALAIECFRKGAKLEQDKLLLVGSSYNSINLIAAAIESGKSNVNELASELKAADALLTRQTSDSGKSGRSADRWAWADLGQVRLLLSEPKGAEAAYSKFAYLADGDEIASAVRVLEGIAVRLRSNSRELASILDFGIQYLKSSPKYVQS
jgi:tetratricopeptide (TPR) repeat protein